jgi:hypothetical protein
MRIALVIALLAAYAALALAQNDRNKRHAVPVRDGEFVTLHVGYPGTEIVFWLRWDADYVTVRQDADLGRYSQTLSMTPTTTDMVCFGLRCERLPLHLDYAPVERHGVNAALQLALPISGHHGVLGLGAGSPVWDVFRYYSFNRDELVLSSSPHSRHHAQQPGHMDAALQLAYLPVQVNHERMWAQLRLDVDYSFVPANVLLADKHVRLRLHATEAPYKMRASVRLDGPHGSARAEDGVQHRIVRPTSSALGLHSERLTRVQSLNADSAGWNASDTMVLGRALLSSGFTVYGDAKTGQLSAVCHWSHRPWLLHMQYWPFYLVLLGLLIVWIYVVGDSAEFHARLAEAVEPGRTAVVPPGQQVVLVEDGQELVLPPQFQFAPLAYPKALRRAYAQPTTHLSYRDAHFMDWLALITRTMAAGLLTSLVWGFGFMGHFWRHGFDAYDQAAVYSALVMLALYATLAGTAHRFGAVGATWGKSAVLLALWLVAAIERTSAGSMVIMVLCGGWAAIYALQAVLELLVGRLWPLELYWPRSREDAAGVARLLAWTALLGVLAAWWCWFFAFYTVTSVVDQWSPESPAMWTVAAFSLAMVFVGAARNTVRTFDSRMHVRRASLRRLLLIATERMAGVPAQK